MGPQDPSDVTREMARDPSGQSEALAPEAAEEALVEAKRRVSLDEGQER